MAANKTPAGSANHGMSEEDLEVFLEKKKARNARRRIHNKLPEAGELNLTAMMDMLTILLVFLLKNYTTSPAANLAPGLNPPMSNSRLNMDEAIAVAVSRSDVSVDNKKVLNLVDGKIEEAYLSKAAPLLVPNLKEALLSRVEHHKKIESMGGVPFNGNLLVIGDRSVDYKLLSQILYSAGQAQLANYKFVVLSN